MNAIFKKLNYKSQRQLHILNAPASFKADMNDMAELATVNTTFAGTKKVQFFLGFVTKQKEVDVLAVKINALLEVDGVLWFAYPKRTSKKYTCEFNRDNGWTELGKLGFEPVRMVAIDEDWSALRFRKAENIKTMTRSSAISTEGKKKLSVKKSTAVKKTKSK